MFIVSFNTLHHGARKMLSQGGTHWIIDFVETKFWLRKDRRTYSISIISMEESYRWSTSWFCLWFCRNRCWMLSPWSYIQCAYGRHSPPWKYSKWRTFRAVNTSHNRRQHFDDESYTAKNVVAILMKTGLNNALLPTLFKVVNNKQYWTILLHPIEAQQYCSILLTSVNNVGGKTLFNPVEQQARRFLPCSESWRSRVFAESTFCMSLFCDAALCFTYSPVTYCSHRLYWFIVHRARISLLDYEMFLCLMSWGLGPWF
jgi:hypothetical protein